QDQRVDRKFAGQPAQCQISGADCARRERYRPQAAHCGTTLQHSGVEGSPGLPAGDPVAMNRAIWLMVAALPLAAHPKLLINAKVETHSAASGLESQFKTL